jgi:hypothetical protein
MLFKWLMVRKLFSFDAWDIHDQRKPTQTFNIDPLISKNKAQDVEKKNEN